MKVVIARGASQKQSAFWDCIASLVMTLVCQLIYGDHRTKKNSLRICRPQGIFQLFKYQEGLKSTLRIRYCLPDRQRSV